MSANSSLVRIRLLVSILTALAAGYGQTTDQYLPLRTGMSWQYRVQFPGNVSLPYLPIFESPEGLMCTSVHCGTGSWNAGEINFTITVGDKISSTADLSSWKATLDATALRFFFFQTDPPTAGGKNSEFEVRLRTIQGGFQLEIVQIQYLGSGSPWRLVRPIAHVTSADLASKQSTSVVAGQFQDVVTTTTTVTGFSGYATGTWPTDVSLAPNTGMIKAVGKNPQGATLYTLELTKANTGGPAGPVLTAVNNGASFQTGVVSGSWITLWGSNLSQTSRLWGSSDFVENRLPKSLDGVSVKVNGKDAPIYYISPGQVNALAPTDTSLGPVDITLTNANGTAAPLRGELVASSPGLFMFDAESRKYVAAVHADGVYVGKSGLLGAGAAVRPAKPGDIILLYGTGFGLTSPAVITDLLFSGAAQLANLNQLTIRIGSVPAQVQFAGLTLQGLYQFNVVVPDVADGDQEVIAEMAGVRSQAGALITIQR